MSRFSENVRLNPINIVPVVGIDDGAFADCPWLYAERIPYSYAFDYACRKDITRVIF